MHPRDDRRVDFDDVRQLIRRSWLWSVADTFARDIATSIERSRIVDGIRQVFRGRLGRIERARLVAVFVLSAAVGEAIVSGFVPEASAPAVPRALWLIVAIAATVPALAPQSVIAAWDSWKRRRY